jgi:HlyD family secretion protein
LSSLFDMLWAGALALIGASDGPEVFPGYVEADFVYAMPVTPGRIGTIVVAEGQRVRAGEVLFTLDQAQEAEALAAAEARVAAAEATLVNLQSGARDTDLDVTRAALAAAISAQGLAEREYERARSLRDRNNISDAQVDAERSRSVQAEAEVSRLKAQLAAQQMPARDAELDVARANVALARAEMRRIQLQLEQRVVMAPASGRVERLYYSVGEVTGAGPVLSILPDDGRLVRFFVPQDYRSLFASDVAVPVGCDGCPAGLEARMTWMASEPEFTPPIIFSREERARLVWLAEATLPQDVTLLPGQPVTVGLPQ